MIKQHKQGADLLMQIQGIDVSKYEDSFLENSLRKRMAETGYGSAVEYCAFLEQDLAERTAFIDSLRISYSEFSRNPLTFAVLERIALPALALKKKQSGRKEIRIWSAACAGGEEAYSLAILLEELRSGDGNKFTYRIFATDQSETQVTEAMKGRYAASAVHNLSLKRVGEWFTRQGDFYTIKPKLKEHIGFSTFDLFNEETNCPPASIFGDFDLVVCANMLFYYKDEHRNVILGKIGSSLVSGGYLMTGETERDIVKRCNYNEIFPQSAIFQV